MVSDFNQLYYQNSYIRAFDATIIESKLIKEQLWLRLDQTAFYPEGGGQAGDTGTFLIDGYDNLIHVLDTIEEDGLIWHQIDIEALNNINGRSVHGEINWEQRYDRMIQHSAEHIFSGLVNKHFNYDNVGFHINDSFMTIDFNGPLTASEIAHMEQLCNEAITKNIDYEIEYYDSADAVTIPYRSKIDLPQAVRIVNVPGYDRCACCGTQVRNSGEIGLLKVIDHMSYKGGVRLTLLAGQRALTDYSQKHDSLRRLSVSLSSPINAVEAAVQRLENDLASEKATSITMTRRLVQALSTSWPDIFSEASALFVPAVSKAIHKELAKTLSTRASSTVLLCSEVEDASISFTICGDNSQGNQDLLTDLKQTFEAKGGGKANFIAGQLAAGSADILSIEKHMADKGYKTFHL